MNFILTVVSRIYKLFLPFTQKLMI